MNSISLYNFLIGNIYLILGGECAVTIGNIVFSIGFEIQLISRVYIFDFFTEER